MEISSLSQTAAGTISSGPSDLSQATGAHSAFEAARKLNALEITDREFSVVRDPVSQRFVVVVRDQQTGTVLDQFPPEDVLRMLEQLSPFNPNNPGGTQA